MAPTPRSPLPPTLVLVVIGFGIIFFLAERVLGPVDPVEPTSIEQPDEPAPRTPPQLEPTAEPEREAVAADEATEATPAPGDEAPADEPAPALRNLTVLLTGLDPAHAEGHLMLQVAEDADADHLAWVKRLTPVGEPIVLEGLPAEPLTLLLLQHEDWTTNRDPVATLAVDLRAGDAAVELVVPPLYDLEVHAPGLDPGATLAMDLTAGLGWRSFAKHVAKVDDAGNATFVGLPAGAYTLHAGGTQLELELPSAPVVFE